MRARGGWPTRMVRLPGEWHRWTARAPRAHAVVLHGRSLDGPDRLSGALLEVLVDVEQRGLHIVLVAARPSDLDSPVATVCRHVVSADAEVLRVARLRWGEAQVIEVHDISDRPVVAAISSLPAPESRTLRRRLWQRLGRLGDLLGRFRRSEADTR